MCKVANGPESEAPYSGNLKSLSHYCRQKSQKFPEKVLRGRKKITSLKLGRMVRACWVRLAASAGSKGADLTDVPGNQSWNKQETERWATPLNNQCLNIHDLICWLKIPSQRLAVEHVMVSPSLARDADPSFCLQRGRSSCGSMGSSQRDTELALNLGFCCTVRPLLSVSSWSLLTASSEKDNPFSWKKRQMLVLKNCNLTSVSSCCVSSNNVTIQKSVAEF